MGVFHQLFVRRKLYCFALPEKDPPEKEREKRGKAVHVLDKGVLTWKAGNAF